MRVVPLLRQGVRGKQRRLIACRHSVFSRSSPRSSILQRQVATTSASPETHAAPRAVTKAQPAPTSLMHWPKVYLELGKVRLSGLVVATTASGYFMGCTQFDSSVFVTTLTGTFLAALSANTFNQWYEIANDAKMGRTMKRPLPSGRISPNHALMAGITQGIAGPALLTAAVNPLAGAIAGSTIVLYAGCYTPLKVVHPINTWVGAVVGGLPPLIGYAAATGTIDAQAALLGAILYSWQFPHFMALAHYCKKDYLAGGYKMLKDKAAAAVALRHSIALVYTPPCCMSQLSQIPMSLAAPYLGMTTWAFGAESIAINAIFAYHGYKFYEKPNIPNARQLFRTSLWQLPLLLACMAIHKQTQEVQETDIREPPLLSMFDILPNKCTARTINEIVTGP